MPTNVQCPHCGQHLEAAESIEQLAGEAIECPVCRRTFLIENLGQAASRNNGTRTAKTEQRQRVGSNPGQTSVAHTPASPRRSCCAGRWLAEGHKQRKLLALGVLLFLVFGFAITVVFWLNFSRVKVQAVESKPVPNPVANAIELVENSVQLRLEKGDEKNPSLASYILKWETDEHGVFIWPFFGA